MAGMKAVLYQHPGHEQALRLAECPRGSNTWGITEDAKSLLSRAGWPAERVEDLNDEVSALAASH
eukprot:14099771-Alexandrium_andersonii.AAC.1